jgi:predicted dehydrogenase
MDHNENSPMAGRSTRRDFIKKASTAAAVVSSINAFKTPVYGQTQAPSVGVTGANNRLLVGFIGVGGQGMAHVRSQKEHATENNIAQVAVCDVSKHRMEEAKDYIESEDQKKAKGQPSKNVEMIEDHRKLLERKDIDAVVIATVDHWHTRCSVDAMNAGKHVYVEKPMTRYLGEAFEIYDSVKKTGKVLQVGSQGCSDQKWHKAAEWIKEGKIGPLVMCQGSYMRNDPEGEWNYTVQPWATAQDMDWNHWLGPVKKKVDFNADHYFRWRKYYPYCAGLLGDLFPHKLHPYMLATGNPEFPVRVAAVGTRKVLTDKHAMKPEKKTEYIRDVPEIIQLIAEFPSGLTMVVASSTINAKSPGFVIYGHHATLNLGNMGEKIELVPEKDFADELDPELLEGLKPTEDVAVHEKNWFDCIRSNKQPNGNIDLAVRVQTVISLAEMSERLGITCHFDEKSRKIYVSDGKGKKEIPPITYDREIELAKA